MEALEEQTQPSFCPCQLFVLALDLWALPCSLALSAFPVTQILCCLQDKDFDSLQTPSATCSPSFGNEHMCVYIALDLNVID